MTLTYPLHRLLWSRDAHESGPADPEKDPTPTKEAEGTLSGVQSSRSPINTYVLPSSAHKIATTRREDNPKRRFNSRADAQPPDHSEVPNRDPISDSQANVRFLPLISSIFVPFSFLLAVPGLTEHWYIRTNDQHEILESQANPPFFVTMLGISMGCAVVTNICILVRLSERMVKQMTVCCIIALTIHGTSFFLFSPAFSLVVSLDILNITAIIFFIIKTQTDDGFILGQAFWMTSCSSIASLITNATLALDHWRTSDPERDSE